MNKRQLFNKTMAWSLIAAMVNPAAITPALARDTDIFLKITASSTTAEPNILIALGTNDRMNVPEPWREYPGAYDSHVEYLWNNIKVISNSEVPAESATQISTALQATNPTSPWGFWFGATLTDRQALWAAARDSANATEPGDPGPRNTWRNYNDLSLLYWVPSAAPITDARLRSVSLNTFRGHVSVIGGVRGNVTYTPTPPYPPDVTFPGATPAAPYDFRALNQCASSVPLLTPSTVFAPTTAPTNAGVVLNQQWVRYERWLNLTPINVAGYPGTAAQGFGGATSGPYYRGYLDSTVAPTQVFPGLPVPPPPRGTPPTNTYRDDDRGRYNGVLGQPIRIPDTPSYAGWTDLKADRGGFELLYSAYYYQFSPIDPMFNNLMPTVRSVYGYPKLYTGTYDEVLSAYKGNRDAAPAFGMATGTPAYYDQTYGNCSPTTGPSPATSPTNTTCINVAAAGAPAQNATWRQNCVAAGSIVSETDATPATRFKGIGLTCSNSGSTVCTFDPRGLACAGLTPPALSCGLVTQNNFITRHYDANCSFSGQTPVTVNTCNWSGRSSVFVEGQGTYFYGGSCQESGSTASCAAGGSSLTLNGIPRSNVVGPFTGVPPADGTTTRGCSNTIGAGTYKFGGTCGGGIEYTVSSSSSPFPTAARALKSPTECNAPFGGVVLNIRGTGSRTYNQTCTGLGDLNQTCGTRYGTACPAASTLAAVCPANVTASTVAIPAGAATNNWYQVYRLQNSDSNLVHDCIADEPAFNPGANTYMTSARLAFGADYSTGYTTTAGLAVATDASKNINVYSVNYLNWKFGPKGPTAAPIGRKTRLQIAKDALSNLVQTTDGVRFGLMVHNRTASDLTNDGANVVSAIRRMGSSAADPAYANRAAMIAAINSVVASSRTPLTETLYEAYRYFSGRAPVWGTLTTAALGGGQVTTGREATSCTNADPGTVCVLNAAGAKYNSPMLNNPTVATPAGCQKNFIVLITNGQPEDDAAANAAVKTLAFDPGVIGTKISPRTSVDETIADTASDQFETAGLPYGPVDLAGTASDRGYIWLDELAHFMFKADVSPGTPNLPGDPALGLGDPLPGTQGVSTYTIGFAGVDTPVLRNAADMGNGKYYLADDSKTLAAALTAAVASIRDWNPTVASPTVPISALNRTESSNDVYLSFFQPDPSQAWLGTVKKFLLGNGIAACGGTVPDVLCLTGQTTLASGNKNIEKSTSDPITGAIDVIVDPEAVSFWNPLTEKDGGKPDRGGTGFQLINTPLYTPDSRKVYTFLSGGVSGTLDLTAAANAFKPANAVITKTLLGNPAMTDATRETLINFIRGGNPTDPNCSDLTLTTVCNWRAWAHFDVQHSSPAIVTYDVTTGPVTQYVFYLSGEGLLHAVDANTGKEQWTFLIEEALPQIAALLADSSGPQLQIADGSIALYQTDINGDGIVNGADKVWLYFGLRRGGRTYYAIDITNKDVPAFKWKITGESGVGKICPGTGACASTAGFNELGQTWSTPFVAKVRALGAGTPALIFGGGYDPAEDSLPPTTRTMGRAVYVVNGDTGALVQSWGVGQSGVLRPLAGAMNYAIPSDVTAINSDLDAQNFIDRLYVGDVGGNVWRFDINDLSPANWRGSQLANLSVGAGEKRKFLFAPAVARQSDPDKYFGVYIGSGDREHPLCVSSGPLGSCTSLVAADKMFMLMDRDIGLTASDTTVPILYTDLLHRLNSDADAATPIATSAISIASGKKGWDRGLDNGEKVINSPNVFNQKLRFGTYTPLFSISACIPPGSGRLNEIDAKTGNINNSLNVGVSGSTNRYYASFISRGFVSSPAIVVSGGGGVVGGSGGATGPTADGSGDVFVLVCADGICRSILVGKIGIGTKIYWYLEPEQ